MPRPFRMGAGPYQRARGDTFPIICIMRNPDSLAAVDLTGNTSLLFYLRHRSAWAGVGHEAMTGYDDGVVGDVDTSGVLTIDGGTATVVTSLGDKGYIKYGPAATDLDVGGVYEFQFRAVLSDATIISWPQWGTPEARLVVSGSGVNL